MAALAAQPCCLHLRAQHIVLALQLQDPYPYCTQVMPTSPCAHEDSRTLGFNAQPPDLTWDAQSSVWCPAPHPEV